ADTPRLVLLDNNGYIKIEHDHMETAPELVHAIEHEPVALIGFAQGLNPPCSSEAVFAAEIPRNPKIHVARHRQAVDRSHATRIDWFGVVIVSTRQRVREGGLPAVTEALRDGGLQP